LNLFILTWMFVPPVALRDLTLRIDIDEDVPVAPKIFT
jgi:hypothetical protein